MPALVRRPLEFRSVSEFLLSAARQPSVLVIEGEPGIGKSTIWLSAMERAVDSGFRVFSARVGQAEWALAFAAVADLLRDVDAGVLAGLPDVQRVAVDRILLRASSEDHATDQHVAAAAFAAVFDRLSADSPVLIAIDDAQWLDRSSQDVVAFAARRFKGRVGLLVTERSDTDGENAVAWLQLSRPDGIERVRVGPLSLGGLHALISGRLGRSFARPTMARIAETSGGNPFFALELARAMDGGSWNAKSRLPGSLTELMRLRIGRLDTEARGLLLAAASVGEPTVQLLAQVTSETTGHVVALLHEAEAKGIIGIEGDVVRFAHPLLARSVYADARPAARRAMHRALAETVVLPELKARHMALAASSVDPQTLKALDAAAHTARARGAPAAAAELLELAIGLGGDTPSRRIRAAAHHLQAGDADRAHDAIVPAIERLESGVQRAAALNLLAALRIQNDSFDGAAKLLSEALDDAADYYEMRVRTLLLLCYTQLNAGRFDESRRSAQEAVALTSEDRLPTLASQANAVWAMVNCMCGGGVDEPSLQRALVLEDLEGDVPISFRGSTNRALILAWTGDLDEASSQMSAVRGRCVDRGAETDLMFVAVFTTLIEIWQGRFADAVLVADETLERAQQLGGDHMRVIAMTVQAAAAAYTGNEREARHAAHSALEVAGRCGSPRLADWSSISLGFLEVSLGNYVQALTALQPLTTRFDIVPGTEIITSGYIPDAVEALVALDQHTEAGPMIEALELNGQRLDRPWMLAVGARCRSMWLAAQGDITSAYRLAKDAMAEHERLPMPFERARTQLLLGQLERRQRQKDAASHTFGEALRAFESLGAPLWADRARAELARTKVAPSGDLALTPSEQRVAELAASGKTNRDVAAALFISAKTVETNLGRIYRKLGINTRAELGRLIGGI
jgi:DNA-binding CsgD family transcriptional regulator